MFSWSSNTELPVIMFNIGENVFFKPESEYYMQRSGVYLGKHKNRAKVRLNDGRIVYPSLFDLRYNKNNTLPNVASLKKLNLDENIFEVGDNVSFKTSSEYYMQGSGVYLGEHGNRAKVRLNDGRIVYPSLRDLK